MTAQCDEGSAVPTDAYLLPMAHTWAAIDDEDEDEDEDEEEVAECGGGPIVAAGPKTGAQSHQSAHAP